MNSLPTDLLQLFAYHLSTSEIILFGSNVGDCQEYIDVCGDIQRFKIALRQKDLKWIHETRSKINPVRGLKNSLKYGCFWLVDYFVNRITDIDDEDDICGYLYTTGYINLIKRISKLKYKYPHYICGKRGVVDIMNDNIFTNTNTRNRGGNNFVRGLAAGQHKELFDIYARKLLRDQYSYYSYLIHFNDEQYIIDRLNMFDQTLLSTLIRRRLFEVVSVVLERTQHNIQKLVHLGSLYTLNSSPMYQLLLKKKMSIVKDFKGMLEKHDINQVYLFIACLNSDTEALDFIYDHYEDHQLLLQYTEIYCMSDLIHTHKQLKTPKNIKLFDLINRIRPYINECVNDYIEFRNLFYNVDIVVVIFQGLIEYYAKLNNMKAIRELFQIAIDYFNNQTHELINILYSRELLKSPFFQKIHKYRSEELDQIEDEARLLGIQTNGLDKYELIIEIVKTKIIW